MASASYESDPLARMPRTASGAKAGRTDHPFWRGRERQREIWRGVWASAAIAGAYVVLVAGLRWMLTPAG
jgi:hypothetical protein